MPGFGLAETAELAVRISLKDDLSRGISGLTGKVNKLNTGLGRAGKGVGQLGAGFSRAGLLVGGAAVTGLVAAGKAAIDFEDAFAGVRKTVDEADLTAAGLSFEKLEQSFRGMATEIPIAATEFARLGETAGALGVKAQDIEEFVRVTALMGVTTNISADEAADAFGRIGTILGLTGDDYRELADSIVALGNAGASTESEIVEITKRFAAEARSAGLLKEEIVGLASVTASLGFAPERGGTALARVFANMGTNIALANKKGKAFAKLVGKPIIELQDAIDRGEGLPIFLDVLEAIRGLSPTEANRTLKALGITNTSDRTIFRAMSQNLPEVTRQLGIATEATGALSEEATKRFDTIASKIQVFKNNIIEAGISIGEGMLPAIGRATEELSAFLRAPENQGELKKIGEDIGEAIDSIDWGEVLAGARDFVGVMKGALSFAKQMFDLFNKLPSEIKAATVGLLALNKLSGGLIGAGAGNILGGLGETIARNAGSKLPGVGKLFAQPVFVTNWPPGAMVPGGGVAGGKGGFGKLLFGLTGVGFAALLASEFEDEIQGLAEGLNRGWRGAVEDTLGVKVPTFSPKDLEWPFGPKNTPTILPELFGGNGLLGGTGSRRTIDVRDPSPTRDAASGMFMGADRTAWSKLDGVKTAVDGVKTSVGSVGDIISANTTQQTAANSQLGENMRLNATAVQGVDTSIKNGFTTSAAATQSVGTIIANNAAQDRAQEAFHAATLAAQGASQILGISGTNFALAGLNATVQSVGAQQQAQLAFNAVSQAAQSASQRLATIGQGLRIAGATRAAGNQTSASMSNAAGRIVGAIWAARPVIQSTTVVQKYSVSQRGGSTTGSRSGPQV